MNRLASIAAAALIAVPMAAGAQTGPAEPPTPKGDAPSATDRLQEGAAAIVEGLRMLMDQFHSYQPPEVLPNGDIIIRRRPPQDSQPTPPSETPDGKKEDSLKL